MQEHTVGTEVLGKERYKRIQQAVRAQASTLIRHGNVALDITNHIMLGLVIEPVDEMNFSDWVRSKVESLTEFYVADLWKFAYRYALILVEDEEAAQDITQIALTALLKSRTPINYVRGWVKSTVYKQSMLYLKNSCREREFIEQLEQRAHQQDSEPAFDETDIEDKLSDKEMRKCLPRDDYRELKAMLAQPSLKEYARVTGQSYANVRKNKHRLMRDLKANYLRRHGWLDTPVILSYRLQSNIRRFMQTLVDHVNQGDISSIYRYCPKELVADVEKTFEPIKSIFDWGLTQLGTNHYEISICDAFSNSVPVLVILEIKITRGNFIHICRCYPTQLMTVMSEEEYGPIPTDKGSCLWEIEDIKRLIS